MCVCVCVLCSLYYIDISYFCAHFLESFYHKLVLNFVKSFSALIKNTIWFLFFNLLMWCITLIDLWILKNFCIPGINPTWSWCMIFLMYWIWTANILSIWSYVSFNVCTSLLIFYLDNISTDESGVLKYSTITTLLLISPFIAVNICLIHWGAPMLGA